MVAVSAVASTGGVGRWPTGTEYAAQVQQPTTSFSDPELQHGDLTLTPLGIPASASGQSAIAFHMQAAERPVAVRCLLSEHDDGRLRYRALEQFVRTVDVPAVAAATWLDEGIRVHGRWWPVVVMPWVPGDPLHFAIEDRVGDPARLRRIADRWLDLVETLQDKRFAHGDYQHGNVLLTDDDEFNLVDLDGIWVPDMGLGPPNEYGHPNYQHINRSDTDWGPHVDTFSALVIAVSILALAADADLVQYMTGENMLFTKADFEDPTGAEIWRRLAASDDADVVDMSARLMACARAGRPPAMSVREVLDASFDPSTLESQQAADPPAPVVPPPPVVAASDAPWWTADEGPADPALPAHSSVVAPQAPREVGWSAAPPQSAPGSAAQPPVGRPHRPGLLVRVANEPVLAGMISGAIAGLVGSILAGILQTVVDDPRLDGGLFVGMIAAVLGGMVHSWPAIAQSNPSLAMRRFVLGSAVGLIAGVVAVLVADITTRSTLEVGDTENAGLVAYVWALTAALVGLGVGLLCSPKAGAYAFAGGAIGGFVGGLIHGFTGATFEARALQVDGFDGRVLITASFVAMLIGVLVSLAIRTARSGSFTIVDGPGQGTVVDFHSDRVSIGGSSGDTLVILGHQLVADAISIRISDRHAHAVSRVPVIVDGVAQPDRFVITSGQVMAFVGLFVRFEFKSADGHGGTS